MQIRSVLVPDELVEAHRDSQLVLFVGAGASRDAPSGLPDFSRLTRDVLEDAEAHDLLERFDRNEPLDTLLGLLAERGVDVNRLVASQLDRPGSEPNLLHRAIVALARSGGVVRIVTTNYDRHLSTALDDAAVAVEEYRAPALPMGGDFDGIVYLHGSLNQDPRRLIVTDQGFGRAYLRDAWAARFLERMYSTYTVLFVGYSHTDTVLRYLARSLSGSEPRFVLTDQPDNADWRSLGIVPIGYERLDESHQPLHEAVEAWATDAARGLLDHRQRVRELVGAAPTGVPEEESYLEATLADDHRVGFFAEFAEHDRWLQWAARRSEFRRLFDRQAVLDPRNQHLGRWFVDQFVLREERTDTALASVREAGGRLSQGLWEILCGVVSAMDPRPSWLGPWIVLLIEQAPSDRVDLLEYLLEDLRMPSELPVALLIFDDLTRPRTTLGTVWNDKRGARIEISRSRDEYWLRQAWAKLAPCLPDLAPEILPIADRHLRRIQYQMTTATADNEPFDPLSWSRPAIDDHAQNNHLGPLDVLIDAARDSLVSALEAHLGFAHGYLDAWATTSSQLLRRLSVHGLTKRPDLGANDKLDWMLRHGWLFAHELRSEICVLLRSIAPDFDDQGAARLIDAIDRGTGLEDLENPENWELRDRIRYDRLTWALDTAPDLPGAHQLLATIAAEHPDWEPSEHPEQRFSIATTLRRPNPPMSPDEFHQRLHDDSDAVLGELWMYETVKPGEPDTSWEDVLGLIAEAVKLYPSDGLVLLDNPGPAGVAPAVVHGWSRAALDKPAATATLKRILELDLQTVVRDVADLLVTGGLREDSPTEWYHLSEARQLASRAWDAIDDEPVPEVCDWLGRAINHPAGKLAEFWIQIVSTEWETAGDRWSGLPAELSQPLEQMLARNDLSGAMSETVIASQLRLLHGADPGWANRHVLPLLDWATPERAERAWHGFLTWGRPTPPLLKAGLLHHYMDTVEHTGQMSERLQDQLARHLAGIATSPDPPPQEWIYRFTAVADEKLRISWLDAIGWMLHDLPTDEVTSQWDGWIRKYWIKRRETVPCALSVQESSVMAGWLPDLGPRVPDAVEILAKSPASFDDNRSLLKELRDAADLLDAHPGPIARILAQMLENTKSQLRGCGLLRDVVAKISAEAAPDHLNLIRTHALRTGCSGAAEW